MKVKLGDVVDKIAGNEDRLETNRKYYIGGEHLDSGSIAIRKYGLLDSDKGRTLGYQFHYPFEIGDVLFMTKNPYLRKCGQVFVSGICSIATFVLRTKDETILSQNFLAVLTQSDNFWNYLEANKSGSVNYFITWRTLADYEFDLPSQARQKEVADLAWSIQRTKEAYEALLHVLDDLVKSQFVEMFGKRFSSDRIKLEQIASSTIGLTYKPENANENDGTIVLRSGNIQDNELQIDRDIIRVTGMSIPENKYVQSGDILMCSRNGSASLVGKCCRIPETKERMAFGAFMTVIRSRFPSFLFGFFQSPFFKEQLTNVGTTSINQITTKMLNAYDTVLPTEDEEKQFACFLEQTDKSKLAAKQALDSLTAMQKSLMRKHLGGE